MLLQLPALPQIPGAHRIIETAGPQLGAVGGDVDARGAVRVTLELPDQRLILQVPHGDVAVAATAEAHLRIRGYRQSVARWCRGRQLGLDPGRRTRQIPDAEVTRLAAHDESSPVGQQLHRSNNRARVCYVNPVKRRHLCVLLNNYHAHARWYARRSGRWVGGGVKSLGKEEREGEE